MFQRSSLGFNLVELMIALSIVTLVASITIPGVLNKGHINSEKYTAYSREASQVLLRAYQQYYNANGEIPETLQPSDLIPYVNYVRVEDSSFIIDHRYGLATKACSTGCLKLHNGGVLLLQDAFTFGVKDRNHYVPVWFDPDGVYSGSSTGPGKSLTIDLHYDGRVVPSEDRESGVDTTYQGGVKKVWSTDPETPWFKGF